jgi:transcription initiation factor TFIID TATA-box-binding protein
MKLQPVLRNIVATLNVESKLDVPRAATEMPKSIYEPEQFLGLIHRTSFGPVCLIFASGKIVIAGAKSQNQLRITANHVVKALKQFNIE